MEYILINESKLKVTLEGSDLEELELSADELDYADPEAKRLFGDILSYAKEEFGFDTSGHRVLLQLYPSKDGGCEIFITRLSKFSESDSKNGENHAFTTPRRETSKRKRRRAFRFERLSHLVGACKRLSELHPTPCAEVYVNEAREWFLLLSLQDSEGAEALDMLPINELSFLHEYGSAEDVKALSLYLGEYGKPIAKTDAIKLISKL